MWCMIGLNLVIGSHTFQACRNDFESGGGEGLENYWQNENKNKNKKNWLTSGGHMPFPAPQFVWPCRSKCFAVVHPMHKLLNTCFLITNQMYWFITDGIHRPVQSVTDLRRWGAASQTHKFYDIYIYNKPP